MASIVGKKRGKATYYYLVESARVDGKPRIVAQEYLGTADELAAAMRGGGLGLPDRTRHKEFGAVAAAWGMLEDLGVAVVIDQATGPAPAGQPLSTGTNLVLAALNRLVAPCSKAGFADWWKTTAADRFTKIPATALDHRRFWDAMHDVTLEQLEEISRTIAVKIVQSAGVDVSSVPLDMTNFATFIDTGNGKAPVAQRGKAKQKRSDLRIPPSRVTTRLAAALARGKTRRGKDKVTTEIEAITAKPWVRRVITWQLTGDQPKDLRLTWSIDPGARAVLEEEIFGKHVLITDHDDWPVPAVVAGYRSQSEAQFSFRQMKDPHVVSFSPMHHWTEHNIRVHVFTCVLALQIAHLMRLRAARAGLRMSVRELLRELAGIGETVLLYHGDRGRARAHRMLTETSPVQDKLAAIFGLARHAPRR